MVYTPINPTFGGNPNNASGLLSNAQAQNGFRAPSTALSPLETFNRNLQQAVLNRLSTESVTHIFGAGNTLTPGTYDTANYTVKVTDSGSGVLTIETTDKASGTSTAFSLSTPAQ